MDDLYLNRVVLYRALLSFSLSDSGRMTFDVGSEQNSQDDSQDDSQYLKNKYRHDVDASEVSELARYEHVIQHGSEEEVSALYHLAEKGIPNYIHDLFVHRALSRLDDDEEFKSSLIKQIFGAKCNIYQRVLARLLQEANPNCSFTIAIDGKSSNQLYQTVQNGFVKRSEDLAVIKSLIKLFSAYSLSPAVVPSCLNALQVLAPLLQKTTVSPYLTHHLIELQLPPGVRDALFRILRPVIKEEGIEYINHIRTNNLQALPLDIMCPVSWYVAIRLYKDMQKKYYKLDCTENSEASWLLKLLAAAECSILVDQLFDSILRRPSSELPGTIAARLGQ